MYTEENEIMRGTEPSTAEASDETATVGDGELTEETESGKGNSRAEKRAEKKRKRDEEHARAEEARQRERAAAIARAEQRRAKRQQILKTVGAVFIALALLFSVYAVFEDVLFPEDEIYTATKGEALALADVRAYLEAEPLSERALIDRLKADGYATSEIAYALEECNVSFTAQAERAALAYLSTEFFSTDGLLEQLRVDGYTSSEAAAAVNGIMNPEALAELREILRDGWTSKRMVIDLLSGMGYNEINILYAFSACPVDFSLQAERAAVSYLTAEPLLSRDALIAQLEIEGFTSEEAQHGADYAIGSLS